MSTETADETTSSELPANLVQIPSGELHERAEEFASMADELLESDRWEDYKEAAANERKLRSEIDRRGAAARKLDPVEAAKVPIPAQERIEQTRQALAEAEKALEAFADVKPRGNTPPAWGKTAEDVDGPAREKAAAFTNLEKLKADLFAMEARTAFIGIEDSQVAEELEDTAIKMDDLRRALKTFTDDGRRAAAAKAERQLAEVTERHYALVREDGVRKSERKKESLIDQMAERKALGYRQIALKDWTRRKEELEESLQREVRAGESVHYDMSLLREATEAVESLTKAIETGQPLAPTEIARQRAAVEATAPHVRGSFRD